MTVSISQRHINCHARNGDKVLLLAHKNETQMSSKLPYSASSQSDRADWVNINPGSVNYQPPEKPGR